MKALENSLAPGTMLSIGESPPFGSNKRNPKKKTLQRNLDLKMRKGASGNGRTIGLEFDAFRLFNAIINHIIDLNRIVVLTKWEKGPLVTDVLLDLNSMRSDYSMQ